MKMMIDTINPPHPHHPPPNNIHHHKTLGNPWKKTMTMMTKMRMKNIQKPGRKRKNAAFSGFPDNPFLASCGFLDNPFHAFRVSLSGWSLPLSCWSPLFPELYVSGLSPFL